MSRMSQVKIRGGIGKKRGKQCWPRLGKNICKEYSQQNFMMLRGQSANLDLDIRALLERI